MSARRFRKAWASLTHPYSVIVPEKLIAVVDAEERVAWAIYHTVPHSFSSARTAAKAALIELQYPSRDFVALPIPNDDWLVRPAPVETTEAGEGEYGIDVCEVCGNEGAQCHDPGTQP